MYTEDDTIPHSQLGGRYSIGVSKNSITPNCSQVDNIPAATKSTSGRRSWDSGTKLPCQRCTPTLPVCPRGAVPPSMFTDRSENRSNGSHHWVEVTYCSEGHTLYWVEGQGKSSQWVALQAVWMIVTRERESPLYSIWVSVQVSRTVNHKLTCQEVPDSKSS